MALVADLWRVSYTFQDGSRSSAESVVHLPATTTEAEVIAFSAAFSPLVSGLSEAYMTGYTYSKVYSENAPTFEIRSNVREKIRLNFITDKSKGSSFAIPGCVPTILAANGADLNTADAGVTALINAYITGIGGLRPIDYRGALMVSLRSAYKQHIERGSGGRMVRKG